MKSRTMIFSNGYLCQPICAPLDHYNKLQAKLNEENTVSSATQDHTAAELLVDQSRDEEDGDGDVGSNISEDKEEERESGQDTAEYNYTSTSSLPGQPGSVKRGGVQHFPRRARGMDLTWLCRTRIKGRRRREKIV